MADRQKDATGDDPAGTGLSTGMYGNMDAEGTFQGQSFSDPDTTVHANTHECRVCHEPLAPGAILFGATVCPTCWTQDVNE